ncbi:MAG: hypothetical protein A3E01_18460 [Gammaproteobacteria bacterium RIFCSPHIGHO2_12_FULL_63_22]|nr:MAG: hypothetical protein A3E01_18460 [Gammaproteobacteria bacterium RIFCSPHIGHO2_12_FULL_63_22]
MTTNAARDIDAELEEFVGQFYDNPLGYVRVAFPWAKPDSELWAYTEPRVWQCEFLEWLGDQIRMRAFDGITPVDPIRAAVSSGHGVGKGALCGMLTNFIMSTRRNAKGTVTANTATQLDDKTWAAIQWWCGLSLTDHWFERNSTILYRKGHRESWRVTPQTCSEDNSEAFAGQHSAGSTSFYMNDEDSNVPEKIHEVQEGGLAKGEPMYFLFGNPTRRGGSFYEAVFGTKTHRWKTWVLDAREVEGHNDKLINEYVEDYGEESDFFRVRVQGIPPNASDSQYISSARVREAQERQVLVLPDEPLVAGCDLAWGGDDYNVIRFRRGRDARSIPPIRIPGRLTADPGVLTNRLAEVLNTNYNGHRVAMLFLDSAGIAGAIGTRLRALGHENVLEVNFGADSPDPKRRYMRDYMWAEMNEWLPTGAIPTERDDRRLAYDLQLPGLRPDPKQRVWLESKEDIKKRTLKIEGKSKSPDDGDALALTFAQVVKVKPPAAPYKPARKTVWT